MALGSPQAIALGVSGGLIALIAVSLLYGFLMRKRATRLGLPQGTPERVVFFPFFFSHNPNHNPNHNPYTHPPPLGLFARIKTLFRPRNTRTAAGAYEGHQSSYNAGNPTNRGRGFASHDDDAWDTRVAGYDPYEEERELSFVTGGRGGRGAVWPEGDGPQAHLTVDQGGAGGQEERRGRTRSRSPEPPR